MIVVLDLALILFVVWMKFFFHRRTKSKIDDHYYHLGIISGIRTNNHGFLNQHPRVAYESNFCYPQGIHWLLSFFNEKVSLKIALYQPPLFFAFSAVLIYFVSYISLFNVNFETNHTFCLTAALFYILTPFNYANWNSKNSGISIRSAGIFLSQLFVVCILISERDASIFSFFFCVTMAFLALLVSQFGFQFILFYSIVLSIMTLNFFSFSAVLLACGLYLILFGKTAVKFFTGQFNHKYLYFKYLYKKNILSLRRTIYKDAFFDVWVYLKNAPWRNFTYVLYNPILSISLLMPFNLLLIVELYKGAINYEDIVLLIPGYFLFFTFSFKRTRFLGEPERYVEIIYPFTLIVVLPYLFNYFNSFGLTVLSVCGVYSLVLIFLQYLHAFQFHKPIEFQKNSLANELIRLLEADVKPTVYIASNNSRLIEPMMMKSRFKVLKPILTSLNFAGLKFEEIYDVNGNFRIFGLSSLQKIIDYYHFDYLIIDKSIFKEGDRLDEFLDSARRNFQELGSVNNSIIVYQIL